jgi:hypothetical protein
MKYSGGFQTLRICHCQAQAISRNVLPVMVVVLAENVHFSMKFGVLYLLFVKVAMGLLMLNYKMFI